MPVKILESGTIISTGPSGSVYALNAANSATQAANSATSAASSSAAAGTSSGRLIVGSFAELTSSKFTYGTPGAGEEQVAEGDIITWAGPYHTYEVLASGATDEDLTTTGGVKLDVIGPIKDVRAFGATGDGATDDTTALVAAATSLDADETLHVPKGAYLYDPTSAPLTIAANNIRVTGEGTIKISDSSDTVGVLVSGDNVTWDGPAVEGDGTVYSAYTPTTEDVRWALLRITGDGVEVRKAEIRNPYLNGLHAWACDGLSIGDGVTVSGGPVAAAVSTYFQGIRLRDCTNWTIDNPYITTNVAGGKVEEGLLATGGSNGSVKLRCSAAWDHGVYCIGVDGLTIDGCNTVSNQAGIACSPPEYRNNKTSPTKIVNNTVRPSATVTSSVGLFARDMHNAVVSGNSVEGFPRSYQISPVQYDNVANYIEGIAFSDNSARGWTEFGVVISGGGLSLGRVQYVNISGFDSIPATSGLNATASHISAILSAGVTRAMQITDCKLGGNQTAYPIKGIDISNAQRLLISGNVIEACSQNGIALANCTFVKIYNNILQDAGTTAINLTGTSSVGIVSENIIQDGSAHVLAYGIDGNNGCNRYQFRNNTISGWSTLGIRRCQQSGHTNTFSGNVTGADALTGTVTLGAATTTTVNNDNINIGLGYTSYVRLTPINDEAGDLISATAPFARGSDYVAGTSFTIRTSAAAAGTEQFFYEIVQ